MPDVSLNSTTNAPAVRLSRLLWKIALWSLISTEFWETETSSVSEGRRARDVDRSSTYETHKKPSLGFQHFPKGRKKLWKGATWIETKPIPSFSPSLCILQWRKKIQEWILLEKHAPIVKKVSVFFTCHLYPAPRDMHRIDILYAFCVHLERLHVFVPSCVHSWWMVTMVNLCANSSERKSKEAEKL